MIYLLSDIHGGESMRGIEKYLEICTDSDSLIILGDLSLNFGNSEENRKFTEWFLSLNKNIALIDGNHENHAFINSFPNKLWCGGEVHQLTDSIVHLKRGNIYTINERTFFVMGGCKSSEKWKKLGLWYDGENPNEEEISLAYENLKKYDNKVDYILTHKYDIWSSNDPKTLEGLSKYINKNVEFKHWYSGHSHCNQVIDELHTIVYDEPVKII